MARALRIECEDVVYHVTARGNERKKIFFTKLDHEKFLLLYLIKKHTGATNKAIGEVFGGITYSAVSKQYQRFIKELKGNRKLKKEMHKIERGMSNVKV